MGCASIEHWNVNSGSREKLFTNCNMQGYLLFCSRYQSKFYVNGSVIIYTDSLYLFALQSNIEINKYSSKDKPLFVDFIALLYIKN